MTNNNQHHPHRLPVHCSSKTMPNGKNAMLCKIGFNSKGDGGLFLYCKLCHDEHFLSLAQITASLNEMTEHAIMSKEQQGVSVFQQQLLVIQQRLEVIGAHDDSIALVEKLMQRSELTTQSKVSVTQIQVIKHMMKMREVVDNYHIYNDLQELAGGRDEVDVSMRKAMKSNDD